MTKIKKRKRRGKEKKRLINTKIRVHHISHLETIENYDLTFSKL